MHVCSVRACRPVCSRRNARDSKPICHISICDVKDSMLSMPCARLSAGPRGGTGSSCWYWRSSWRVCSCS
eukprot:1492700-Rhodomonas_salina.1